MSNSSNKLHLVEVHLSHSILFVQEKPPTDEDILDALCSEVEDGGVDLSKADTNTYTLHWEDAADPDNLPVDPKNYIPFGMGADDRTLQEHIDLFNKPIEDEWIVVAADMAALAISQGLDTETSVNGSEFTPLHSTMYLRPEHQIGRKFRIRKGK